MPTPEKQLAGFLAKYDPAIARDAKAIRAAMRRRLPGATELVYDNYQWLVIGFGPTERASDAIFSIVLAPRWVTLCFLYGAKLPDPEKRLRGTGSRVRSIRLLDGLRTFEEPAVQALIDAAVDDARVAIDPRHPRRLIIKAISARQKPRRPAVTTAAAPADRSRRTRDRPAGSRSRSRPR